MSLADRTRYPAFSNGTEGMAWTDAWCEHCVHDHDMHGPDGSGPGCDIMLGQVIATYNDYPEAWPEAWLPEPDDGQHFLPSRLVCLHFSPCEPCGGDPGARERAERVAEVKAYWEANR